MSNFKPSNPIIDESEAVKFSIGENEPDEEHKPHHLFCEMDELQENLEWREAARWLKFEEEVENGGRWSKPHVATLSLHSLFELRSCLLNGAILLDFPGEDLPTIIDGMIDYVVKNRFLREEHKESVRNALLLKHVHQHEKEFQRQINTGEKKSFPLIKSLADMGKKASHIDLGSLPQNPSSAYLASNTSSANLKQSPTQPIFELGGSSARISKIDSKAKINQHFMRKIPFGAEASNVLVGEVEFLDYQFTAFVRLSKAVILGDFTEVPVPTRFLFIILGPKGNLQRYHEIGRSIATIMSDEIFHDVAYKAKNKHDILSAFDVFLDQVTVLPPGEWDPKIRLDPPNKLPLKQERLEKLAEVTKINGSGTNGFKKHEEEIQPHDMGPGLEFTGRFCGGLIDDIKRKVPWFLSDFTDGLNFQCLSSIMFMYFACLAPIITFGGLLGTATDQNMSAIESLLSGAICGILYSLFAGQPITILGSTGPVLVFETILNQFSKDHGIDYIGFRAWVGLWTFVILTIIVVTDCSALVKYITRFTEESFATLIAIIFIKESVAKLFGIRESYQFSNNPNVYFEEILQNNTCGRCINLLNQSVREGLEILTKEQCENLGPNYEYHRDCSYSPDVFFVSVCLYLFTFILAMGLRAFRTSPFFPSFIRSKVADFGVVITIVVAVLFDMYLGFDTPKLMVPLKFQTTIPSRGWFINPIERNKDKLWLSIAAVIPALLATILIFMDQHITAVIVNRKENKLKKGSGYHLDLLIVGIAIGINSLLGIPWFVAATVLSINHVLSLKKESEASAPGEKPKFLGVNEQRLTGTVVFMLIGSSVFLSTILRKIPMPVLYGIFLYMGISSLNGIQLMQRVFIFFMPEKHQPDLIYLRHVRTWRVHVFTLFQIGCLVLLFVIKMNKKISILFPVMVLGLVGIRKIMDYIFTQKELSYLDDIMPELTKRIKEDGKGSDDLESQGSKQIFKQDSINISTELSRTHIWQELVNSDKQLASERETLIKRKKPSVDRTKPLSSVIDKHINEEAHVPLMDKNVDDSQSSIPTIVIEPSKNVNPNNNNSTSL